MLLTQGTHLGHCGGMERHRKTAQVKLRMAPELREAAQRAAADDKRTLTSLMEKLLDDHVRRLGYLSEPAADQPR